MEDWPYPEVGSVVYEELGDIYTPTCVSGVFDRTSGPKTGGRIPMVTTENRVIAALRFVEGTDIGLGGPLDVENSPGRGSVQYIGFVELEFDADGRLYAENENGDADSESTSITPRKVNH